jgi:hypothetical protein
MEIFLTCVWAYFGLVFVQLIYALIRSIIERR